MHVLVSGAGGYIGTRLIAAARARGIAVTTLGHGAGPRSFAWTLGEPVPAEAFAPDASAGAVDAVIHLAHQWSSAGDEASDVNVAGTAALLAAARAHGISRFVFASSLSAQPNALNRYGRLKWRIEQLLSGSGEVAARIGLVYGGPRQGQWGTLYRIATLAPVVPMVTPWRQVQPVHLDDLCDGLLRLAEASPTVSGVVVLADPEPLSFARFLSQVARHAGGRTTLVLPVPLAPVLLTLDLVNRLPFLPRIDRERVLGLAGLTTVPSGESLRQLGLRLRPLAAGLTAERPDRRRAIAREGAAVLSYVLGRRAKPALIRRYVRAIEHHGGGVPLAVRTPLQCCPALMRLVEPLASSRDPHQQLVCERLHVAALVIDATPEGARQYPYHGDGKTAAIGRLVGTAVLEAMATPFRLALARWAWR